MKKLFAVLMAIALVLSMGTTFAFAADEATQTKTGSITINNAFDESVYNVYKMLDFEPSNAAGDKGVYVLAKDSPWEDFFMSEEKSSVAKYFDVKNNNGKTTVTLKEEQENDNAVMQEIATAAIAYAKANSIPATATQTAAAEEGKETAVVEFTGLKLGYYAIDTALGTICALSNTNSDYEKFEKNEKPSIDKQVQEDADNSWGEVNDADIDQQVNYKAEITVGKGATNYVMHDTMEAGLTFNNDVKVYVGDSTTPVTTGYTVVTGEDLEDDDTFEVVFDNNFIAGLAKGTKIRVEYSATLNENAKIVDDGNDNTVYLSYGEDHEWTTPEDTTSTYTWKLDVFKYMKENEGENEPKIPLAGAKFQLLDKDGNAIKLTKVADTVVDGVDVPTYMVDINGTTDPIVTEETTGKFIIVGLDEGSYKLHETEAPAGYNKLANDMAVVITSEHKDADLTATYKINNADPATIEVENKTGGLFPETGGIGTTIFYLVGGLLMLGAFVFLVSKKRMATAA